MRANIWVMGKKLVYLLVKSSVIVALAMLSMLSTPKPAHAHEVLPTVADIEAREGAVFLTLRLNAEALLAGIDLDGLDNTETAPNAAEYDRLRALTPAQLEAQISANWGMMMAGLSLTLDGTAAPLSLLGAAVDPQADLSLPRVSQLRLTAPMPQGTNAMALHWPKGFGDLVLRQQGVEPAYTGYITGGQTSPAIALAGLGAPASGAAVFFSYIPVGFDHILPKGMDHILFVLGLFFLSTRLSMLLWQISAFTLAHTVTLALGALGWVSVPGSIVEPLIAASIVFVAVENITSRGLSPWRPAVVFGFGLLHGLGFASVLGEFGLPEAQFIPALIGFNIGVEIGQLTVVALAFLLVFAAQRVDLGRMVSSLAGWGYVAGALVLLAASVAQAMGQGAWMPDAVFLWGAAGLMILCMLSVFFVDQLDSYRRFVAVPASVFIGAVGAFWVVERLFL
jgi:hypothetical protein